MTDSSPVGGSVPSWPLTDPEVRAAVDRMLHDGSWGRYHGPHGDALRTALADYHQVEHVHLCCSGTSALELCLKAVGVRPGDEVILAAYDYKAGFATVLALGAVPVLVDTLPAYPALDPERIAPAVTERTRAVIVSHLHGCLAPMDETVSAARAHGLAVVEDACQVPGARQNGRPAGTMGDVGALSFGGSKLLTAGRGGAVVTDSARCAQRIRLSVQRGNDAYPLSEMQAAVLLPQLQCLDERNSRRQAAVERLTRAVSSDAPLRMIRSRGPNDAPTWYKVAWLLDDGESRESWVAHLKAAGIAMDTGFPALHRIHARSRFRASGDLSESDRLHERLLTLHHPVLLADEEELLRVAQCISAGPA